MHYREALHPTPPCVEAPRQTGPLVEDIQPDPTHRDFCRKDRGTSDDNVVGERCHHFPNA